MARLRRARFLLGFLEVGFVVAIGAGVASGIAPRGSAGIPDTAFRPVTVPGDAALGPRASAASAPTLAVDRAIPEPVGPSAPPPPRPDPSVPPAPVVVITLPPPSPRAGSTPTGTHSLSGPASWYCRAGVSPCTVDHPDTTGFNAYAAAGPKLRAVLGSGWRGRTVSVDGIRVTLIDWCQCHQGEPNEKLLDLYYDVFARTGSAVTIRW